MKKVLSAFILFICASNYLSAQNPNTKFRQLHSELPDPSDYRNAAGAPGKNYWQQQTDYEISVELDDVNRRVLGSETITYHNNSPDELGYLWLQLDQNTRHPHAESYSSETQVLGKEAPFSELLKHQWREKYDGGYKITSVKLKSGEALSYVINKTMMRIDLPKPLKSKEKVVFSIDWNYYISEASKIGGRTGYEYFQSDGNCIYEISEWYPRMCQYSDYEGWQHKQFLGRGEFTLGFGNFDVKITAPADHIVAATGELQNSGDVLTLAQKTRWRMAEGSTANPVIIATEAEAKEAEKTKSNQKKTWRFKAEKVRDFAWASSRKFIWDAMAAFIGGKRVMCMSYYPKEGNPLWEKYSTQTVAHTVKTYSKYTVNYEYPVAISVNGPVGGMEFPMICFNGPRAEPDGTYSEQAKIGLISVVIHEVGHNFFPMIISSDERQWTWQDEGFNTFIQGLTEREWDRDYPTRRSYPEQITDYMRLPQNRLCPLMTTSDEVIEFGPNAYGKTSAALTILRETVMGRELFDYAFKEYCRRWAYKHPAPADFFRTMEDASGMDLDWFFRGWFFTTEPCDVAITDVKQFRIDTQNPDTERAYSKKERENKPKHVSKDRDRLSIERTVVEQNPDLMDFYDSYDRDKITAEDRKRYRRYLEGLNDEELALLHSGKNVYQIDFDNVGGLITPLILEINFTDGTKEISRIPAEIWRYDNAKASKVFIFDKTISSVIVDPYRETADIDESNNAYPQKISPQNLKLTKPGAKGLNQMQLERRGEN